MAFHYAETHFKFRLPWSPLWRPWPELFLDAPSFCLPGRACPIYLAIKDAHLFPITVLSIDLRLQGPQGATTLAWEPRHATASPLEFLPVPLEIPQEPGLYRLHARLRVRNARGRVLDFWQANYPFLSPQPLDIRRLAEDLPYPVDADGKRRWQAGEMHCHSEYSSDPVEFGAPLPALQAAGHALGLDFIQVTDHSYDFGYNRHAYMQPVDATANFAAYQAEVAAANAPGPQGGYRPEQGCRLIAGEEVSCGNARGENVHLLVMGPQAWVPGMGDSGRRGLQNRPDLSIEAVLERLGPIPSFAAHPRVRIGRLERFIFRRGPWDSIDLGPKPHPLSASRHPTPGGLSERASRAHTLRGLQFWNGARSTDFIDGRRFWVEALLAGHQLLPIGANDAHGDFNQNVGVKFPLFSLYRGRNHVLGKVRTLFPAPSHALEDLQAAARGPICTATDGPFLSLVPESGPGGLHCKLTALSSGDWGPFKRVSVVGGQIGQRQERRLFEKTPGTLHFEERFAFPPGYNHIRAEVETTLERFALSSAIFAA